MARIEGSESTGPGHERNAVSARGVVLFLVSLAVASAAVSAAVWGVFRLLARDARAQDRPISPVVTRSMARLPPHPRLEDRPLALRVRLNAQEKDRLSRYGWVDKKAGTVHIPIGRAIDLLLRRGIAAVQPNAPGPPPAPAAPGSPAPAPIKVPVRDRSAR